MNTAKQAKSYREEGKYLLALSCAQLGNDLDSKAEESLALCWLGHIQEAEQCATEAWKRCSENVPAQIQTRVLLSLFNCQLSLGKQMDSQRSLSLLKAALPPQAEEELQFRFLLAKSAFAAHNGLFDDSIQHAKNGVLLVRKGRERILAEAFHALADAYHRAGKLEQALNNWRMALELRKKSLRVKHPEIATNIDGMALTLRRLNMPEIAISLHKESLSIYQECFDQHHPAIAACHHGLSQCYSRIQKAQIALFHMNKALTLSEQKRGADHIDTWITRFELGRMEVNVGSLESGYARMERAYLRASQILGPDHPTVLSMDRWRKD